VRRGSLDVGGAGLEEAGDDPAFVAQALGTIARSGNVSELARRTGMSREGLYKALSADGNPSFATIVKVARALGLRIRFTPAARSLNSPVVERAGGRCAQRQGSRRALALDVVLEIVDGEADAAADADWCEFVVPDELVDGRSTDGEELGCLRDRDEQRWPRCVGV
jgi:probable addiction module antidote protein